MKLAYLTLEAPREGQASYVHVHEIINGLEEQGVDVELYEPSYTGQQTSPRLRRRFLHSLSLQFKMWLKWRRGSALYIRGHYLAFPSAVIANMFKIPIIHEINGPYEDVFVTYEGLGKVKNLLIALQRWQYVKASKLIAVTKELQKWANDEGKRDDCAFISNGANVDIFKPADPNNNNRPDDVPDKYVVFFGGLTKWHGVTVMLEAIKSENWPKDIKLVVIGKGHESVRMSEAAKHNDNVIYMGKRPYKEVAIYVAHALASIIMISNPDKRSTTGVFPLKLFETLACGAPAIVSDLPGQADFVRYHNCGEIVPVDDSERLINAIKNIAQNPDKSKEMGIKGREVVVKEHSWYKRSEDTLDLIKQAAPTQWSKK